MDDCLLDTSWTLHCISRSSPSYRTLITSTAARLSQRAEQLQTYLTTHTPKYKDDLNDESDRTGQLHECKWTIVPDPEPQGLLIQLIYTKTTFKFILYGSTLQLILSRSSAPLLKRFQAYLDDTFSVSASALKLPSSLLLTTLADLLRNLTSQFTTRHCDIPTRLSILKSTVGTVKLTITFSTNTTDVEEKIAPNLRAIDLDIPSETVAVLSSDAAFLDVLGKYILERTGLRLPLTSTGADADAAPMRVAKITCAAFAIAVEGRLKFASRPVETLGWEDWMRGAYRDILEGIVRESDTGDD